MKRLIIFSAVLVAVIGLAVGPAEATCSSPLTGVSGGGGGFYGTYINFGDPAFAATGDADGNGVFVARFWQTNNPALSNEGGCTAGECGPGGAWVRGFAGYPGFESFYINFGDGLVFGCPAGNDVSVYLENQNNGHFVLFTVANTQGNTDWDFTVCPTSAAGTWVATHGPRPQATSSSRAGTDITVAYNVADATASTCDQGDTSPGTVTGIQVYTCASATRPGLDLPGCWTAAGPALPATGGASDVTVDCADTGVNQWIASGLLIDGQAPFFVGSPVEVECDPTLADPGGRRQRIERPDSARPRRDRQ